MRRYSLDYLLSRQPKSLRKYPDYSAMIAQFESSPRLQSLRISRRCYSLLNNAGIAPENLQYFYRTYRLPADPFFPLFFKIKREYLADRERRREERRRYILETTRSLPPSVVFFIKYLGRVEQHYNMGGHYPVWQEHLYPSTKKQVNAYRRYGHLEWVEFFRRYLARLERRYRGFNRTIAERLIACFILDCLPADPAAQPRHAVGGNGAAASAQALRWPPEWPTHALITKNYRRLSLQHHPDRGGDGTVFIELKWARDVLKQTHSPL